MEKKFKKGDIVKTKTKRYINVGKKSKPDYQEIEVEIIGIISIIGHQGGYEKSPSYKQLHVITLQSTPDVLPMGETNIFVDSTCELTNLKITLS